MKRICVLSFTLLLALVLMIACGKEEPTSPGTSSALQSPTLGKGGDPHAAARPPCLTI